jgi:Ice-binding-like
MKKAGAILFCAVLCVCLKAANPLPVPLGTTSTFAVLGGSTVTNTGPTVISGDLGLSPGSAVTGFPPGSVTGGSIHVDDSAAVQAQNDLTTAYNDAAGRLLPTPVAADLAGLTLFPGVYKAPSSLMNSGSVILDGQGNPNAVFIFQIPSTLTTASGSHVILINGATANNVFWQVGASATLGTGSSFQGTILALTSITATTGASILGRLLARNGAVTLDTNLITGPTSVNAPPPGGGPGPGPGSGVPAPSSVILVAIGLACTALYQTRERLLAPFRKN